MFDVKCIKEKLDLDFILKVTVILCAVFLLAMCAVFRANFNYIDDLGRTLQGYRGWENFSRYISTYLSVFVHAGRRLTDISPLPQIISVIWMAFASSIIIKLFSDDKKITIWNICAVVPMTLSPYFLECLSYKFDAPYMALSVLVSIIPFGFYKFGCRVFVTVSVLGLLVMCMTYQASSGIYPLIAIFLYAKFWNEGIESKKLLVS